MNLFRLVLLRSRTVAVAAVIASLISGLLSAAIIFYANQALGREGPVSTWLIWGFFLLGLFAVFSRIGSEGLLMRLLQESLYQMRRHLISSVLKTPLTEVEHLGEAKITATLTSDVNTVSNAIAGLPLFMLNLTIVLACGVFMLNVSPIVAMIGAILVPFGIFAHKAIAKGTHSRFRRSREKEDDLFEKIGELTGGIKELKLSETRRDQFLNQSFEDAAQAYKKYKILGLYYFLTTISLMKYLFYAYLGIVLFVLPHYGMLEKEAVIPCVFIILYGIGPLSTILHWLPNWSMAQVALNKIEDLGLTLNKLAPQETLQKAPDLLQTIQVVDRFQLDQLTYAHRAVDATKGFMLGPVNLTLQGGTITFLVGGNGSGKTTLAKLITGLYEPKTGHILVNGEPLEPKLLRELFSVVFSDLMLFAELPIGADVNRAKSLLQDLGLGERVAIANGRFTNTKRLSQGQRKRLALVAALLHDRPIYLFDEWAADQDPAFRERFYTDILPQLKRRGKLVIAISHDDRWFHLADQLVHLDYGQIRMPQASTVAI